VKRSGHLIGAHVVVTLLAHMPIGWWVVRTLSAER
jgi:hypothetical protein